MRCRCQDPAGVAVTYLNAFCPQAATHRPHADYGFPQSLARALTIDAQRTWLDGGQPDLAPVSLAGYRPPDRGGDIPEYVPRQEKPTIMPETRFVPDPFPAPILPATEVNLLQHFSRNGKPTKVELDLRQYEWDVRTPPGLLAALKILLPKDEGDAALRTIVTYARGYVANADGTAHRRPIWEKVDPAENDGRVRIKIGEHPPEPADSIRLSVNLRRDLTGVDVARQMAYGHWVDAKPDAFAARSPDGRYLQALAYTPWLERLRSWTTN